jgi:hypothetical protein
MTKKKKLHSKVDVQFVDKALPTYLVDLEDQSIIAKKILPIDRNIE